MRFPIISDITTKDVVSIDIDTSISEAISQMLKQEHRSVVVIGDDDYFILTVLDILNLEGKSLDLSVRDLDLRVIPKVCKDINILDTIQFLDDELEYICVINSDNSLYGLVTHTDITSNMDPDTLMDTYLLEDFLKIGKRMKWVDKDEIVSKLTKEMMINSFDNIIIVQDLKPIGILTTKDIMWIIKNNKDIDLPVSEYMTSPVETINKSASMKDALEFITSKNYKRAVVVNDDGTMNGVIAQKDIISFTYSKWAIVMKEHNNELENTNTILKNQNKEYELKASIDSLTGLYNRYKFSELYTSSYKTMTQGHNDISLIIIDIDFFKKVNDTFGHNIGDQVLIKIAHTLLRTLRDIDVVCRWGGEEFLVLLPSTDLNEANILAQKIRINIENLDIEIVGNITASFGVSQVKEGDMMEDAIDRADKSLYLAKDSGRNCVKTELDL